MPIVPIPESELFKKLGREYAEHEVDELCFQYGLELDEITSEQELVAREQGKDKAKECSSEKLYKIEVPANRYDLLCTEGLLRALMVFIKKFDLPVYERLSIKAPQIFVKKATQAVRPYVVGAILRNVTLDINRYNSFIEFQEKVHQAIGRKRSIVAVGTHDLDTLRTPIYYDALPPSDIRFRPLNKSEELTAEQIMEVYSTDSHLKSYLPLIRDKPMYPVLIDSNNVVLSMPPIINGHHSRVQLTTRNIFIEMTATDLFKASIALDTLVAMFSEYCEQPFTVEPVEVIQHDGSRQIYPRLEYREEMVSVSYVNRLLGIELADVDVVELLNRMGLPSKSIDMGSTNSLKTGLVSVTIPPTRHDVLHACDIVEDVAIAYGYDRIPETLPQTYCLATGQKINHLTNLLRTEIAHAGFTEALSFSLCSRDDISSKLRKDINQIPAVHISNPKSLDFQVVRTSLLSGLLHTLSNNRSQPLPLKLFEVQDIVLKDTNTDVGARNHRRICAVYYSKQSGFEVIHGLLDRLMQLLEVRPHCYSAVDALSEAGTGDGSHVSNVLTYRLSDVDDATYFPGRCANVVLEPSGQAVGQLGILHPEVVRNFDLTLPCSVLDLDMEIFL